MCEIVIKWKVLISYFGFWWHGYIVFYTSKMDSLSKIKGIWYAATNIPFLISKFHSEWLKGFFILIENKFV